MKIEFIKSKKIDKNFRISSNQKKTFVWLLGGVKSFAGNLEFNLAEWAKLTNIFLFSASKTDKISINIRVNHLGENSFSNTMVRGIGRDDSSGEIAGNVKVGSAAKNSSAWFDGRAIIFDEASCRVDPRLEILTSEVERAGHAATVSKISDEDIFYMATRGVDRIKAERLKSAGFLSAPLSRAGLGSAETEKIIKTLLV